VALFIALLSLSSFAIALSGDTPENNSDAAIAAANMGFMLPSPVVVKSSIREPIKIQERCNDKRTRSDEPSVCGGELRGHQQLRMKTDR